MNPDPRGTAIEQKPSRPPFPPLPALTAGLAQFATRPPEPPAPSFTVAREGITDAVGLMIAARSEPVVQHVLAHALAGNPGGACSVLLSASRAGARDAAMVNAVAAHALAMDDVAWGCHPSAVLMPTVMALGEQLGTRGTTLLRAWVVGYEVIAELASREKDSWHTHGWHPTGLIMPVAAAAAAAHLLGLKASAAQHALGIAASFGGGLTVNFGTQTKALHAGRAASAGIEAAQLAAAGVTASPAALEHAGGFLHTLSLLKNVDRLSPFDPDRPLWRSASAGISLKKYPLCYSVHRVTDAAIDLAGQPGFDASRVAAIEVWIGAHQAAMAHHALPATALEARYSVPFAVACGLLARAAGFAQLAPDFVTSAPVRRLMERTRLHLLPDASEDDPVFAPADRVRLRFDDDTAADSGEVRFARGHARLPMAAQQLRQKFMDCTASLGLAGSARLFETLQSLQDLPDVRVLSSLGEAASPAGSA